MDHLVVPTNHFEPRQTANDRAGALAELLARVEAATGPSREIDGRLWCVFTPCREFICIAGRDTKWGDVEPNAFSPRSSVGAGLMVFRRTDHKGGDDRKPGGPGAEYQAHTPPAYTASLDAALALVERVDPNLCWRVHKQVPAEMLPVTNGAFWATCGRPGEQEDARGETPALALLAALLCALLGNSAPGDGGDGVPVHAPDASSCPGRPS